MQSWHLIKLVLRQHRYIPLDHLKPDVTVAVMATLGCHWLASCLNNPIWYLVRGEPTNQITNVTNALFAYGDVTTRQIKQVIFSSMDEKHTLRRPERGWMLSVYLNYYNLHTREFTGNTLNQRKSVVSFHFSLCSLMRKKRAYCSHYIIMHKAIFKGVNMFFTLQPFCLNGILLTSLHLKPASLISLKRVVLHIKAEVFNTTHIKRTAESWKNPDSHVFMWTGSVFWKI